MRPPPRGSGTDSDAVAVGMRSTGNSSNLTDKQPTQILTYSDIVSISPKNDDRVSYAKATGKKPVKIQDLAAHIFHDLRPTKEGDQFSLKIPKDLYLNEIKAFEFALTGRLFLQKGDKPRSTMELKWELQRLWSLASDWQLIPLGKGYFTLRFTTAEDKATAKGKAVWELSKGLLRLREWTRNFDPFKENSPLADVWVRIHYLPIEYWNPQVISGIGRYLGHPLKIDGASARRDFGQFARILVEIDMSQNLPSTLLIDGEDTSFHVEFVFENLPLYCRRCKITGHSQETCRKKRRVEPVAIQENLTAAPNNQSGVVTYKQWHIVEQGKKVVVPTTGEQQNTSIFGHLATGVQQHDFQNKGHEMAGSNTVLDSKRVDDHDSEEKALDEPEAAVLVSVDQELHKTTGSEDEVDEEIEMETPAGDPTEIVTAATDLDEARNSEQAGELVGQQAKKLDGDLDGQSKDSHTTAPEDIDSRISRLEAQVSQGMQMLVEQAPPKRRGRPPKGMERPRVPQNQEDSIKSRLRNAEDMGQKPRDFVIDHSGSASLRVMNNIATGRWSDEMEVDDFFFNGF
ncbi:uncharacterized protein LOC131010072 [Salvia miltiorrhiza]|uniref:uncharacterized protein LOC131010072 n=1 Tax=Salvia miltiorrhiza TaxID=226208 RepID=UPI0025AC2BBB|nr:uncharacterized protein LOC131010072 [Salvia miltiorrhiza]